MRGLVPALCPTTLLPLNLLRCPRSLRVSVIHYELYLQYHIRGGAAETRRKVVKIVPPTDLLNS